MESGIQGRGSQNIKKKMKIYADWVWEDAVDVVPKVEGALDVVFDLEIQNEGWKRR